MQRQLHSLLSFLLCLLTLSNLSAQDLDLSLFQGMKTRNIGPAGMSGRVTAIDVNLSNLKEIYLGTAAGGIWKSTNAGFTFDPIFNQEKTASIGSIAIYQHNPNLIYVGTGEGNPRNSHNEGQGMYKSLDGGNSWQQIGLEQTHLIHRVIVHPDNPDIVWAGVEGSAWKDSEHRGIYKSIDGGKSWSKTLYIDQETGCADLVIDPSNPNKLLAAMWSHRRNPDYFRSGGAGSGLYLSYDGGESWKQITDKQGLPSGELGRIGLSFSPSNSSYVYAYIESKQTGIFRSTNGGEKWERRSPPEAKNIGGRPFYYADIYVDSKNENRLYSIATNVTVSEDGGKTWRVFGSSSKIHTDHHAWWSHPEDPDYILIGNDGGLHITQDRGKKWDFVDHLPLAQFYHVRVDNDIPYNVYGGLQDNGSWIGPSQTWFKGGIRNLYWQRLSVGDGFDVVPDPMDSQYGYAMGQAGNLVRYHRSSGQLLKIKPIHPEGEYLRFNWNTGIGIDPFDNKTVYYGSQYLHKSSDYGNSWEIISPDLTTNDPSKQRSLRSGGLSFDVTGAENYTTIISIAPSPVQQGVIWVGTDDGNVQLTQDGGKSWSNLIDRIPDVPAQTWVPHIKASTHTAGEAFVVFDDHRRGNHQPYIFRTSNFGKKWERIVDQSDVNSFAYCFEQDPIEPHLYFCGTDDGLYVSIDAGDHWHRWTHGYPTVPTRDLVIHPRDHDLVIGTFGRSFWILDDIRPLRAIAAQGTQLLNKPITVFDPPQAILAIIGESIGYREGKVGDFLYKGENRPYGALITYALKIDEASKAHSDKMPLDKQVKIEIRKKSGELLRTLYQVPQNGINRVNWKLDRDAVRLATLAKPSKIMAPKGGFAVPPGTYVASISYQNQQATTDIQVVADPRLSISDSEIQKKEQMIMEFLQLAAKVTATADQIRSLEKSLTFIGSKLNSNPNPALEKQLKGFKMQLQAHKEALLGKKVQGIFRDPAVMISVLYQTQYLLDHPLAPSSPNQATQLTHAQNKWKMFQQAFEPFQQQQLMGLKKSVQQAGIGIW
ncbi:MAG: hypothetical protein AAF587_25280 [Bacteroidota bacterium]